MQQLLPKNTAENILARLCANFPGLINGNDEVPGAELVDWLTNEFYGLTNPTRTEATLRLRGVLETWAEFGSPEDDDANEAGYGL
jgi:hypothetical protein